MKASAGLDESPRHALVIGINLYTGGIPPLRSAVKDAEVIAERLQEEHGYRVRLLRDGQATAEAIGVFLTDTIRPALSAESSFVLYYAGHGVAGDDPEGNGPQGYLLPQDAELRRPETWLGMDTLREALEGLPCRHLLLVLDWCYAGAIQWASTRDVTVVKRPLYKSQYERYRQGVSWQVLTSASHDERAEDVAGFSPDRGDGAETSGHSPFAKALIGGLSGRADSSRVGFSSDGVITATELYQYIYGEVAQNDRQTPGIFALKQGNKGEFVFMAPGMELNLEPDPPLDNANNPWPGVEPYIAGDTSLFFGRTAAVAELLGRVRASRFVAIVGSSGSGKSSLLNAGLVPALEAPGWTAVGMAPLTHDPNTQLQEACKALAAAPVGDRQLLVVDQCEALFARGDDQTRTRFMEGLRALIDKDDGPTVVVALRSDFEPQMAETVLRDLWTPARYVVPVFDSDDLRDVAEGPARAKALFFEPATLVDDLVEEVSKMPGAMPLLSCALADLYRHAQARRLSQGTADRMLSVEDYGAIGGVVGVLRRRATQVFDDADDAGKQAVRRVLLRLVSQENDGLRRRRVYRDELRYADDAADDVRTMIERYVQARLLVVGSDAGREYVEPAHDALVVDWDKPREWLAQSGSQKVIRDAWIAADDWENKDHKRRASKYLWHHNPYLPELERREANNELNAIEREFREASSSRKHWLTYRVRVTTAVVMSALLVLTALALNGRQQAVLAEAQAVLEKDRALAALFQDLSLRLAPDASAGSLCFEPDELCVYGRPIDGVDSGSGTPMQLGRLDTAWLGTVNDYSEYDPRGAASSTVFVTANTSGHGRVIGYAHDGLFVDAAVRACDPRCDNLVFADNALRWAMRPLRPTPAGCPDQVTIGFYEGTLRADVTRELADLTLRRNWRFEPLAPSPDPRDLAGTLRCVNALIWGNPDLGEYAESDPVLREVVTYVQNGGGLVLGGLGWPRVPYWGKPMENTPPTVLPVPSASPSRATSSTPGLA